MKKIVLVLAALALVFTMVSCGSKDAKVASWSDFTKALGSKSTKLVLTADLAWDASMAEVDLSGKTLDLGGHTLSGLSDKVVFNGKGYTIENGTVSGGKLCIGTASDEPLMYSSDVSAADSAQPVVLRNLKFSNSGVLAGIVWLDIKDVVVDGFSTMAFYLNGSSATIDGLSISGGKEMDNYAMRIVGEGTVDFKGTNSLEASKFGIKTHGGKDITIVEGTTTISIKQTKEASELCLQVYEDSQVTVESGATLNLNCTEKNINGVIQFANAYMARSASVVFKSGSNVNIVRNNEKQKLFWCTNKNGQYLGVIEEGANVTIKTGSASVVKLPALDESEVRITSANLGIYHEGTVSEPDPGCYSFYDLRKN